MDDQINKNKEVYVIMWYEYNTAIQDLKTNMAPGIHEIPVQIIKYLLESNH